MAKKASRLANKYSVGNFVSTTFMSEVANVDAPTKINIAKLFQQHFKSRLSLLEIGELIDRYSYCMVEEAYNILKRWDKLGIPCPFSRLADAGGDIKRDSGNLDTLFVTWKHPKFVELTGRQPLEENFFQVLEWIKKLCPKSFLIVPALYLKIIGATRIYITDGPNDGGVDVIGIIEKKSLNSMVFFVQAKTGTIINRETVLTDYGKYLSLLHQPIYQKYRKMLGITNSMDGACYCYSYAANCDLDTKVEELSRDIGILLRSSIQLSYMISLRYTLNDLKKYRKFLEIKQNMDFNYASVID